MYYSRRRLFNQNFLHDRRLVDRLIGNSLIGKVDTVLEIGPGNGILTERLVRVARQVVAVEIDPDWCRYLRQHLADAKNLAIHQGDILRFTRPSYPYRVLANLPFKLEGKIVRYLLDNGQPPLSAELVVMKTPAQRWAGQLGNNRFFIQHAPWFTLAICHRFRRGDFNPKPKVDAVLLRIIQRQTPLLAWSARRKYEQFVERGFGNGLPVYRNLIRFYSKTLTTSRFARLGISQKALPARLTLNAWVVLFNGVSASREKLLKSGYEDKYRVAWKPQDTPESLTGTAVEVAYRARPAV